MDFSPGKKKTKMKNQNGDDDQFISSPRATVLRFKKKNKIYFLADPKENFIIK
jgi:hypothetical protein